MPFRPRHLPPLAKLGFLLCLFACHLLAEPAPVRGVLIYGDGNCATGVLVAEGCFQSDRFGELRFAPGEARFEKGQPLPAPSASASEALPAPAVTASDASEKENEKLWLTTLDGFAERRSEDVQDTTEVYVSGKVERTREGGEQMSVFGEYAYTKKPTFIDRRRATLRGDWRHDLSQDWFSLYRPYAEYDGRNVWLSDGSVLRVNYTLSQQQAGVGYRFVENDRYKLSLSATWNYFWLDVYHYKKFNSDAPSALLDASAKLFWKMECSLQAELFYYKAAGTTGYDLRWELTKYLTDHFRLTLRQQLRYDYPLNSVRELNSLRFLLGVSY